MTPSLDFAQRLEALEKRLVQLELGAGRLERMTLQVASEKTGYSVGQLKALINNGQLGYTCIDEDYRVSIEDLERCFAAFSVRPRSALEQGLVKRHDLMPDEPLVLRAMSNIYGSEDDAG